VAWRRAASVDCCVSPDDLLITLHRLSCVRGGEPARCDFGRAPSPTRRIRLMLRVERGIFGLFNCKWRVDREDNTCRYYTGITRRSGREFARGAERRGDHLDERR